jgi:hypothetical protein
MKKTTTLLAFLACTTVINAQTNPAITGWLRNTTGITGRYYAKGNYTPISNGDSANVQSVYYSSSDVYIKTQGIPAYITGPFLDGNPNEAGNQNAIFKFPLSPAQETGTNTSVTMGNIGVFINGVALFDSRDGASWSSSGNKMEGGPGGGTGDGVWNRNAIYAEMAGFDCAKGHPAGTNYHHHQNPSAFNLDLKVLSTICTLYDADGLYNIDSTKHSPLIGFAYDGFPIYGAYGYKNLDGTGGIVRMKSSYSLRNITVRNTYYTGQSVTAGPDVSSTYFLGYFREDYQYNGTSSATPDYLDIHNGRFCVTPDYPNGTYCYFATVDSNWNSAYPYVVGPTFYGVYANAKVTTIPAGVTEYTGSGLPVNLLSFNGSIYNNATLLKWATASEVSNSSFDVERSTDGKNFLQIGSVQGAGTTKTETNYSFTDQTPAVGINYYRLKELDLTGAFKYSNTISVTYSKEPFSLKVFPNPAADYIIIQANDLLKTDVQLLLTNMKGETVVNRTIPQGSTLSIIETATLYAGDYIVTAYDASGYKKSFKVVIAK